MKKLIIMAVLASILAGCTDKKTVNETANEATQNVTSVKELPWQQITPKEIKGNPVKMFGDEWFELAAGKEGDMNLMTNLR